MKRSTQKMTRRPTARERRRSKYRTHLLASTLVAGILAAVGVHRAIGQSHWFEEVALSGYVHDPFAAEPAEPYAFPAQDLGAEPIVEEMRAVPVHVLERVLALEDAIEARELGRAETVDRGVAWGDLVEPASSAVQERREAPPAMDSGIPEPDIIHPGELAIGPR